MTANALFYFLDLETTGLDTARDEIIEIACVEVIARPPVIGPEVFTPLRSFHAYVMPDRDPPAEVAAINGYNRALWAERGAVPWRGAMQDFALWLAKFDLHDKGMIASRHWAGSNVSGFDLRFLERYLDREARALFSHRTLSLEAIGCALWIRGETEGAGLKHLRKWAGLEGEQAHTAMRDVEDAIAVANAVMRRLA